MSYEDKILDKFADMIMPPGTIIAYQGIEAPEGFIVYDNIKIYEDEFPRLYPVLAANPNFNNGTDEDDRKWVELPDIEDLCIQMTTDASQVGKKLEAQLPNMSGELSQLSSDLLLVNGVFSNTSVSVPKHTSSLGTDQDEVILRFNASSSNAIYNGSTVQSPALQALPCIRY